MAVCAVCGDHVPRYTCPRCGISYCSVTCYKGHKNNAAAVQESTTAAVSCTEAFYHDHVQSVVQLEQKSKQQATHDLIHRVLCQWKSQEQEDQEDNDDDCVGRSTQETMQLRRLLGLLGLYEACNSTGNCNENETDQHQQGWEQQRLQQQYEQESKALAQFPKLKSQFEKAVERGGVLPLVLQPWKPWWRPVLSSKTVSHANRDQIIDKNKEKQGLSFSALLSTLDDQLCNIAPPKRLRLRKQQQGPHRYRRPNLTYNIVEVLYCTVRVLRQYHGCLNAMHTKEIAVEAALTLVQSSSVMSRDARFETLEEVLMYTANAESTALMSTTTADPVSWRISARDLAQVTSNRRYIEGALLGATDILQAAIRYLKPKHSRQKQDGTTYGHETHSVKELRLKRKKLQFFLSWSPQYFATTAEGEASPTLEHRVPKQLSKDVEAWIYHWDTDTAATGADGDGVDNHDSRQNVLESSQLTCSPLSEASCVEER